MDITSAQPQVRLSLLRSFSLKKLMVSELHGVLNTDHECHKILYSEMIFLNNTQNII